MAAIAIDLGGTKICGAVFNENGITPARKKIPLGSAEGKDAGKLIISLIEELANGKQPEGIGVSVPGIARHTTGTVWAPNIKGWEDYPLLKEISTSFGKSRIVIESDRTCSIMGEIWKGSALGCKNVIFMAVGTGIGAGIMIDGKIVHGADDIAGATGWMALSLPYSDEYRDCGCFEYYASGKGITEHAKKLLKEESSGKDNFLKTADPSKLTTVEVFEAYDRNDPVAVEVLDKAVVMWGMAAANFVSLFNPEKIIFGGGVFGPAVKFLDAIMKEALKWAQPVSIRNVRFEPSSLGNDAAIFGSAYMAMNHN